MGVLYRRKIRVCTTCDERLDTTAARHRCLAQAHVVETRETPELAPTRVQHQALPTPAPCPPKLPGEAESVTHRFLK